MSFPVRRRPRRRSGLVDCGHFPDEDRSFPLENDESPTSSSSLTLEEGAFHVNGEGIFLEPLSRFDDIFSSDDENTSDFPPSSLSPPSSSSSNSRTNIRRILLPLPPAPFSIKNYGCGSGYDGEPVGEYSEPACEYTEDAFRSELSMDVLVHRAKSLSRIGNENGAASEDVTGLAEEEWCRLLATLREKWWRHNICRMNDDEGRSDDKLLEIRRAEEYLSTIVEFFMGADTDPFLSMVLTPRLLRCICITSLRLHGDWDVSRSVNCTESPGKDNKPPRQRTFPALKNVLSLREKHGSGRWRPRPLPVASCKMVGRGTRPPVHLRLLDVLFDRVSRGGGVLRLLRLGAAAAKVLGALRGRHWEALGERIRKAARGEDLTERELTEMIEILYDDFNGSHSYLRMWRRDIIMDILSRIASSSLSMEESIVMKYTHMILEAVECMLDSSDEKRWLIEGERTCLLARVCLRVLSCFGHNAFENHKNEPFEFLFPLHEWEMQHSQKLLHRILLLTIPQCDRNYCQFDKGDDTDQFAFLRCMVEGTLQQQTSSQFFVTGWMQMVVASSSSSFNTNIAFPLAIAICGTVSRIVPSSAERVARCLLLHLSTMQTKTVMPSYSHWSPHLDDLAVLSSCLLLYIQEASQGQGYGNDVIPRSLPAILLEKAEKHLVPHLFKTAEIHRDLLWKYAISAVTDDGKRDPLGMPLLLSMMSIASPKEAAKQGRDLAQLLAGNCEDVPCLFLSEKLCAVTEKGTLAYPPARRQLLRAVALRLLDHFSVQPLPTNSPVRKDRGREWAWSWSQSLEFCFGKEKLKDDVAMGLFRFMVCLVLGYSRGTDVCGCNDDFVRLFFVDAIIEGAPSSIVSETDIYKLQLSSNEGTTVDNPVEGYNGDAVSNLIVLAMVLSTLKFVMTDYAYQDGSVSDSKAAMSTKSLQNLLLEEEKHSFCDKDRFIWKKKTKNVTLTKQTPNNHKYKNVDALRWHFQTEFLHIFICALMVPTSSFEALEQERTWTATRMLTARYISMRPSLKNNIHKCIVPLPHPLSWETATSLCRAISASTSSSLDPSTSPSAWANICASLHALRYAAHLLTHTPSPAPSDAFPVLWGSYESLLSETPACCLVIAAEKHGDALGPDHADRWVREVRETVLRACAVAAASNKTPLHARALRVASLDLLAAFGGHSGGLTTSLFSLYLNCAEQCLAHLADGEKTAVQRYLRSSRRTLWQIMCTEEVTMGTLVRPLAKLVLVTIPASLRRTGGIGPDDITQATMEGIISILVQWYQHELELRKGDELWWPPHEECAANGGLGTVRLQTPQVWGWTLVAFLQGMELYWSNMLQTVKIGQVALKKESNRAAMMMSIRQQVIILHSILDEVDCANRTSPRVLLVELFPSGVKLRVAACLEKIFTVTSWSLKNVGMAFKKTAGGPRVDAKLETLAGLTFLVAVLANGRISERGDSCPVFNSIKAASLGGHVRRWYKYEKKKKNIFCNDNEDSNERVSPLPILGRLLTVYAKLEKMEVDLQNFSNQLCKDCTATLYLDTSFAKLVHLGSIADASISGEDDNNKVESFRSCLVTYIDIATSCSSTCILPLKEEGDLGRGVITMGPIMDIPVKQQKYVSVARRSFGCKRVGQLHRPRLRSRNKTIDLWLAEDTEGNNSDNDIFADLEEFIV